MWPTTYNRTVSHRHFVKAVKIIVSLKTKVPVSQFKSVAHMAIAHLFSTKDQKGKEKSLKQIPNSLLNLRFKAPQGRGLLQDDRAYKKVLACKIWWAAVQYASSYGQNTCFFNMFYGFVRILGFILHIWLPQCL